MTPLDAGQDVRGDIYLDSVTALGLTVDKLAVGKVTDGELIDNSLKPPPSGVFGLGFDGSSSFMIDSHDQRFEPFMVRAAKQGTLKKFAFDLTTDGGYIDVNSAVSMDGVAFCRTVGRACASERMSEPKHLTNPPLPPSYPRQRASGKSPAPSMGTTSHPS